MSGTVPSESVSVSRRCSTWIGKSSQPAKAATKTSIGSWMTGVGPSATARHHVPAAAATAMMPANR